MSSSTSLNPFAAMSLAHISYTDESDPGSQKQDMQSALQALPASAEGPWSLVWGPATNDGVLAFVALSATGQYGVAFRGSLTEDDAEGFLTNWIEDLDGIKQVPWLYPQSVSNAKISAGMNSALDQAMGLTDPTTGLSLLDFLRQVLAGTGGQLLVTGHSLGGALATLGAAWLYDQLPRTGQVSSPVITPYSFAAPTVGNQQFATYYDSTFPNSYRGVNTQDVVPMAWANLGTLLQQYPSPGQTLKEYNVALWAAVEAARAAVLLDGYTPVNQNAGTTDAFQGPAILSGQTFPQSAAAQHSGLVYLAHVTPSSEVMLQRAATGTRG
jgi:hypothetical protein